MKHINSFPVELNRKYKDKFKTDKEILVPVIPYSNYNVSSIYGCIIDPSCAYISVMDEQNLINFTFEWIDDYMDNHPFILTCMVNKWLIEKNVDEDILSLPQYITITSIDINNHLTGHTPVYNGYYIFNHNLRSFISNNELSNINGIKILSITKDFLDAELKEITIPNFINVVN